MSALKRINVRQAAQIANFNYLEENNMTLGENIRRIRKERHMTLKQLEQTVGISESYMHAYEVGDRHPKVDKIEAIAIALGVNPEALHNS